MLDQKVFDEVKAAGGCIYGGGTKGQGGALCRALVAPNMQYCPRHLAELSFEAKFARAEKRDKTRRKR